MTTRPGYIWSGTEWVSIGQDAVVAPVKYQATAPTSPATGDLWIDSDELISSVNETQFLRWRKTMSGGETSLSGTDDNGLTLTYTANYEQVYLNGVLLVRGQDYTATTGTSITGLTALVANDVVEVFGVVARTVGDTYTQAQVSALILAANPIGSVLTYAGSSAPTGFLLCNGAAVSRTTYASLYSVISTTYGVGDGSTTFNIPNLTGRVPIGKDSGTFTTLGSTGGAETHVHGSSTLTAGMNFFAAGGTNYIDLNTRNGSNYTENKRQQSPSGGSTGSLSETNTEGVGIFGNTDSGSSLPPYQVLNYIIKAA